MRKVVVAAMALGLGLTARPNDQAAQWRRSDLAVMTVNICGNSCNWHIDEGEAVALETARLVRRQRPHVVLLQEICASQLETLVVTLDLDYRSHHFETFDVGNGCRFGNAVVWRAPVAISERSLTRLPTRVLRQGLEMRDEPRVVGCVSGTMVFCVVHLVPDLQGVTPPWPGAPSALRRLQVDDLVAAIEETRGDRPAVLAGDFNARPEAAELGLITNRLGLTAAVRGCHCIDHVFADPALQRDGASSRIELRWSDHDAVLTVLHAPRTAT